MWSFTRCLLKKLDPSQLLPFVTWIDHPNGGHVFTPEKVTNKPPKGSLGRTWSRHFCLIFWCFLFSTFSTTMRCPMVETTASKVSQANQLKLFMKWAKFSHLLCEIVRQSVMRKQQLSHWLSGWWFEICFIFTPIWGRLPFWLMFSNWVETTN